MKQTIVATIIVTAACAAIAAQAVKVEPTPTPGASSPRADAGKATPKAEKKEAPKK